MMVSPVLFLVLYDQEGAWMSSWSTVALVAAGAIAIFSQLSGFALCRTWKLEWEVVRDGDAHRFHLLLTGARPGSGGLLAAMSGELNVLTADGLWHDRAAKWTAGLRWPPRPCEYETREDPSIRHLVSPDADTAGASAFAGVLVWDLTHTAGDMSGGFGDVRAAFHFELSMTQPTCAISHPTIFLNRSSGFNSKDSVSEHLASRCAEAGMDAHIEFVQAGMDVEAMAREAVRNGADAVVAGGGDGTQRAVAAALAHTDASMGILPVGTWNHFARDLNIPLDVQAAAEILMTGQPTRVDLGEVNSRVFINNSIIGLYPNYRFIRAREERHGRWHWLAYLRSVLAVVKRLPFYRLHFQLDGREFVRHTPFVLIANNEHEMEGYRLGTRSTLTEGQLYVYIMRPTGRWGLLRMVLNLVLGRFSKKRDFEIHRTRELTIRGRQKRLGVSLDGEIVILNTPLHYRSLPGALRVIVPQP